MYKLNPSNRIAGSGPKGSVCLLMTRENGIGDAINALPVVAEFAKNKDVTVYTQFPELWERIGVAVEGVRPAGESGTCEWTESGELTDHLWERKEFPKYEVTYRLNGWGAWDDFTNGATILSRFQQLASYLGCKVPFEFDYVAALDPQDENQEKGYTLFSPDSNSMERTLPEARALELYDALSKKYEVLWIPKLRKAENIRELVNLVWNADRLIGIDNGVAHIAGALGVPAILIGGMTNVRSIFSQYLFYNPSWNLRAIQQPGHGCKSPCYRQAQRGFTNQKCCGTSIIPLCMNSLNVSHVTQLIP